MRPSRRDLQAVSGFNVNNGKKSVAAFVGMGSNLGNRLSMLRFAVAALDVAEGVAVEKVSPVYETEAHVLPDQDPQPDHLNAVIWMSTTRTTEDLLGLLQHIEREAGRNASAPQWSPRPLDLDLLLFGAEAFESDKLTIPHPRLAERRFVLLPLADLVHNLAVPGADGTTVSDLLGRCPDSRRVKRSRLRLVDDPQPDR